MTPYLSGFFLFLSLEEESLHVDEKLKLLIQKLCCVLEVVVGGSQNLDLVASSLKKLLVNNTGLGEEVLSENFAIVCLNL